MHLFSHMEVGGLWFIAGENGSAQRFFCYSVVFCHGFIEEFNQGAQELRPFTIRPFIMKPFTIGGRYELNAHAASGQTGYCPPNQRCLLFTGFEVDQNGYTCRQWSNHGDVAATQADIG